MNYHRKDCRLCGGKVQSVLDLKPTPIANSFPDEPNKGHFYPLGLMQCMNCGHVQIGYVIDDTTLYGTHYKYSTPAALLPYLTERARTLRKQYPEARNVLEIGANNGLFLHALHEAGFKEVIGIDPAGIDPLVWNMPFNQQTADVVLRRTGTIDLIVANNVFAHIDDLDGIFKAITEVLSLTGSMVFEVQYLPDLVDRSAFDMIYHEHRDYHTLGPLARFLRKHGLVMTAFDRFDMHAGSIRVYASRNGKQCEWPNESIDWRAFAKNIYKIRSAVHTAIGSGKIVTFGATAKACTLIHNFGIAEKIAYCVDNTPAKQGRYIPGTAIQILPEEALKDENRQIFITAWNYADYIRSRYPDKMFIIPFVKEARLAA